MKNNKEPSILNITDAPDSYAEWLTLATPRLPKIMKNLPLFFQIVGRRIKKEMVNDSTIIVPKRFNEIVTDLGLEFVVR